MEDERSACRVGPLNLFTAVKEHGVPEQNVAFSGEELFLFKSFGFRANPIVITLRSSWRACVEIRLRIIVEFREPFRPMGAGTVNERAAAGLNVLASNPASEQKSRGVYMEHGHVLMQALAASTRKRDA
jgi:hypothetical protein